MNIINKWNLLFFIRYDLLVTLLRTPCEFPFIFVVFYNSKYSERSVEITHGMLHKKLCYSPSYNMSRIPFRKKVLKISLKRIIKQNIRKNRLKMNGKICIVKNVLFYRWCRVHQLGSVLKFNHVNSFNGRWVSFSKNYCKIYYNWLSQSKVLRTLYI